MKRSQAVAVSRSLQSRILKLVPDATIEQIRAFSKAHIEGITIRPMLMEGMLLQSKTEKEKFLILISDDLSPLEKTVTFFHELIHAQLLIGGIESALHDEDGIDAAAAALAERYGSFLEPVAN